MTSEKQNTLGFNMALANPAAIGLVDTARFFLDEGIDVSKILKWISPDNLIPFSTRVVFANLITALGWLITGKYVFIISKKNFFEKRQKNERFLPLYDV